MTYDTYKSGARLDSGSHRIYLYDNKDTAVERIIAIDIMTELGCYKNIKVICEHIEEMITQKIEQAVERYLRDTQYHSWDPGTQIAHVWSIEDINEVRPDLTNQQCKEVLEMINNKCDSEIGINWDVVRSYTDYLYPEEG